MIGIAEPEDFRQTLISDLPSLEAPRPVTWRCPKSNDPYQAFGALIPLVLGYGLMRRSISDWSLGRPLYKKPRI